MFKYVDSSTYVSSKVWALPLLKLDFLTAQSSAQPPRRVSVNLHRSSDPDRLLWSRSNIPWKSGLPTWSTSEVYYDFPWLNLGLQSLSVIVHGGKSSSDFNPVLRWDQVLYFRKKSQRNVEFESSKSSVHIPSYLYNLGMEPWNQQTNYRLSGDGHRGLKSTDARCNFNLIEQFYMQMQIYADVQQ